jgi:hypothetical protein
VTNFAKDLIDDLKESRLWPLALGLVVALVAVPVVLSKPAKEATGETAAATPATGQATLPNLTPIVQATPAREMSARKSVVRLDRKNPFEPTVKLSSSGGGSGGDSSADAAATGGGSSTTGSGATTGLEGGSGGSTTGSGTTGTTGGDSGSSTTRFFTYVATVKFGEVGQAKDHTIQQLRSLPSSDNPVVVFMGATVDGDNAIFLVAAGAELKGDATCKPSADECVFLYRKPGDEQTIDVGDETGALTTYELKLESIDVKQLDAGKVGGSGASASSARKTRRARAKLRKSRASYMNALGRVRF